MRMEAKPIDLAGLERCRHDLLTTDELCGFLRISQVTLWRTVKERQIPAYRITSGRHHGRIRFLKSEILAWVKSQPVVQVEDEPAAVVQEPVA